MMVEISCKKFETLSCNGLKTIHYIFIGLDFNTLQFIIKELKIEMMKFNKRNYFILPWQQRNIVEYED